MLSKRNGIQPGAIADHGAATTTNSRCLDQTIREAIRGPKIKRAYLKKDYQEGLLSEPEFSRFRWITKLDKRDIPGHIGACEPDGGVFLLDGLPVLFPEGKTQKNRGNAEQRFGKNREIARYVAPAANYVTFASGDSIRDSGKIDVLMKQELAKENPNNHGWDHFHFCGSTFIRVDEDSVTVDCIKHFLRLILRHTLEHFEHMRELHNKLSLLRENRDSLYANQFHEAMSIA
jgi:hypothetical protein